jgi:hypothetical protein
MASSGGPVVEQSTLNPKFKCFNPAFAVFEAENSWKKASVFVTVMAILKYTSISWEDKD